MHYYQYNIADYRKDTTHLTLLEHGCYRQLLDQYYLDEKPLPADEDKLFRLFNARTEDEKQAMRNVLLDFWTKTEAGYVQGRSDREIQTYKERLEIASKAGRKSADLRANSNGRSTGVEIKSTGVLLPLVLLALHLALHLALRLALRLVVVLLPRLVLLLLLLLLR